MMLDCRAKNKVKSSGYSGDILRKIIKQSDLQIKVFGPKFKNLINCLEQLNQKSNPKWIPNHMQKNPS